MDTVLNPIPSLLVYGIYAPTILRVAGALTFAYIAWVLVRERREIEKTPIPLVGHASDWMIWISVVVTFAVAVGLFLGYETQWAALIGMLIALKHGIFAKHYKAIIPLSRGTYVLLFIICLSLLVSGAGAVAMDLPL